MSYENLVSHFSISNDDFFREKFLVVGVALEGVAFIIWTPHPTPFFLRKFS